MNPRVHIETERLILRDWRDADAEPFAVMNADQRVMEFFAKALSRPESNALMANNRARLGEDGYGKYATEEKASGRFIGYVGLALVDFPASFAPATEIGWRLAREAWGQGFATEAAAAVRDHAFSGLAFEGLVSFTAEWNQPSRRVMEKIGMSHDPTDDFIHPKLPQGHKLAPHVLYRINRQWR